MSQSLETRWAPVQAALERASKKQRANPIGEKLDTIEEMLRAWLAADSDDVGDEARAASLAALHARIEAEGLLDAIKAHSAGEGVVRPEAPAAKVAAVEAAEARVAKMEVMVVSQTRSG